MLRRMGEQGQGRAETFARATPGEGAVPGIDRPIFIIGPHRSGTTVFFELLGTHPDVGYPNVWTRRFPSFPRLGYGLMRVGGRDHPREAQRFWDYHWRGDDDVMTAEDATPEISQWYRSRVARMLALRGAPRMVAKYPRLSFRMGWLDRVFPGALFVHVVRDWRAVVSSTVRRKAKREERGGGWFGVRPPGWREMTDLPHEVAAARLYRLATEEIEREGRRLPGRVFTVRYGALCASPVRVIESLCSELGLAWTADFAASLPAKLTDANYKWREQLDPECVARIRSEAPEFFARFEE
jgi:hypothetical protein